MPQENVKTSTIWLMPIMLIIYMLTLFPFGISSTHWLPMYISLGVSVGFASFIQILWIRTRSLGTALLLLFLPLLFIGMFAQTLAPIISIAFIVTFFLVLAKNRTIHMRDVSLLAFLFVGGVLALMLFQRSSMGYAQPFMGVNLHKDTLFHMAISSMIKNYGIASTGLYGLVPIQYHTASHAIFSSLSLVTDLSVFDVYAYIYPLVFIPLMLTIFLCLAEEVLPSRTMYEWGARAIVLSILLIGLDIDFLWRAAFRTTFYVSESYTVAFILLTGMLSMLFQRKKNTHDSRGFFYTAVMLLLFMLTCFAKISVAFVFLGLLISWMFFGRSEILRNRIMLTVGCFLVFFVAFKMVRGGLVEFELFHFIKTYVVADSFSRKVLVFFVFHFLFSNILIVTYVFGFKKNKKDQVSLWLICGIVISTIMGAIPGLLLSIPGGSASYFSSVSQIMALPFLIILVAIILEDIRKVLSSVTSFRMEPVFSQVGRMISRIMQDMSAAKIITLVFILSYFLFAFIPQCEKILSSARVLVGSMKKDSTTPYHSPFIAELQKVSKDSSTKDMMVYIPRDVLGFWKLANCKFVSFILPAFSERSVLRGLPATECGAQYYGYSDYKVDLSERSQLLDSDDVLRKEARELGFKGVLVLTEKGTRAIR